MTTAGPGVLDAFALLTATADELLVGTVRDTHLAVAERVHAVVHRAARGASTVPRVAHQGIAGLVYGAVGLGLRAATAGAERAAATGHGPALEDSAAGRFLSSAVNGLIGDRLIIDRPELAITLAVRHQGRDVPLSRDGLAAAFPEVTGRLVVLLHGLCESEAAWGLRREERGTTYAETLAAQGWTPVLLRANTGLPLRENGVALTVLLRDLVAAWPAEVTRVALVGHSMGGLILRAAAAVAQADGGEDTDGSPHWTRLVTDVVTLGTPHLGTPVARSVTTLSDGLQRVPETSAVGRFLDWRSTGVLDLVTGLAEDVPPLPHARYRLVSADRDLLVRADSAAGRDRRGHSLFPDGEVLRVPRTGHFGLLNHPEVEQALLRWLA